MIEILILILGLLIIGSYKKDFTTLIFSGFGFVFYGLMVLNQLIVSAPYNKAFGYICICYGLYISFRASIDLITYKRLQKDYD